MSNNFNLFFFFYSRFNIYDFTKELSGFENMPSDVTVHIDRGTVFNPLRRTKERRSRGPDGIGSRILKNCALQPADILCFLFNMSLQALRVPQLWKDCFPHLISNELYSELRIIWTHFSLPRGQAGGVEDATGTLLNRILRHLEGTKTFAK